ncbi:MAG: hypothetical protein IPL06_03025 [Betaproteobacteria bacterium]|nr:hypothetical protein [Betaproteobacteria bacterium]
MKAPRTVVLPTTVSSARTPVKCWGAALRVCCVQLRPLSVDFHTPTCAEPAQKVVVELRSRRTDRAPNRSPDVATKAVGIDHAPALTERCTKPELVSMSKVVATTVVAFVATSETHFVGVMTPEGECERETAASVVTLDQPDDPLSIVRKSPP